MEQIGRYQLKGELGRGGMGVVYQAVDPLIGRNVAIKTIRMDTFAGGPEGEFLRDRLFREARPGGRLIHPGIGGVFCGGQEEDTAYIPLQPGGGPTLSPRPGSRPQPNPARVGANVSPT